MIVGIGLVVLALFAGYEAYRNRTKIEVTTKAELERIETSATSDYTWLRAELKGELNTLRTDVTNIEAKLVDAKKLF